jgi:Raf kinase inhibitor-like YbhB/YbcL family protein
MMTLSSSSFRDSEEIPQKHGNKAENVSPRLSWENPPEGTRSFALAVVDTHPVAQGYVHWLVIDIPADTAELEEGAAAGAMPAGSREVTPYAGPFPPSGTHDYEFTLYALNTEKVDLPRKVSLQQFTEAIKPNTLATAKLVGKFTKAGAK